MVAALSSYVDPTSCFGFISGSLYLWFPNCDYSLHHFSDFFFKSKIALNLWNHKQHYPCIIKCGKNRYKKCKLFMKITIIHNNMHQKVDFGVNTQYWRLLVNNHHKFSFVKAKSITVQRVVKYQPQHTSAGLFQSRIKFEKLPSITDPVDV